MFVYCAAWKRCAIHIRLLEHVSPIEWENVILYGQYVLDPDNIR